MKIVAIIPARMASSRFPGKPLAPLLGLPMIEHVYRRAALCNKLSDVFVATCDPQIQRAVEQFGGRSIMTSPLHQRGTDRIAEAVRHIPADIVVNIQGDEPLLHPEMIGQALRPLIRDRAISCVNLMAPILSDSDFLDPNEIKVVVDHKSFALYMSRSPIPSTVHGGGKDPRLKQVCVIPFRRRALMLFRRLQPTPLEKAESIDMMRFIENRIPVKMVLTSHVTQSVDTPEDGRHAERLLRADPLTRLYRRVGRPA